MAGEPQEKIAVYIDFMGETPEAMRAFAEGFSRRFNFPLEKVMGFSGRLPVRVGSYDLEKAKKIGIEIKKLGGEVTLKRVKVVKGTGGLRDTTPKTAPAPPPPRPASAGEDGDKSWFDMGSSLSKEELGEGGSAPAPEDTDSSWISRHDDVSDSGGEASESPPDEDTSWISRYETGDADGETGSPPPEDEQPSWLTHGSEESQQDLESFSHTESKGEESYQPQYDYTPDEVGTMPDVELGQKRKIGKLDSKTTYTADESSSLEKEAFAKASQLYAGRKTKSKILSGPIAKIIYLAVIIALAYYGYTYRQYIIDYFIGPDKWALEEAYMVKVKPDVVVPSDLTGTYRGKAPYKMESGVTVFVEIEFKVAGNEVRSLTVDITPHPDELDQFRTYIEYGPGRFTYLREVDYDVVYHIEDKTFKPKGKGIAQIDKDKGRFRFSIAPMDVGIDPTDVPDTEKDSLGSAIFLNIEGIYGDTNTFYGGLMSSTLELVSWQAKKKK